MTTLTVGTNEEYSTIKAAVAAAQPGDTVAIDAGTYTDDFPGLINGLTIKGVGGMVKLVTDGAQPSNGKAYLEVEGTTTLVNLDISGVTVPDNNGAAVRYDGGDLVIQNSILHNNQDGILGANDANGTIVITGSEVYSNGVGDGYTHNIYIGDIKTFTLTDSYVHDANVGHEVKSRAETNIITNNRIDDNSSTASYEIDLPNGGNATITGNTIQKSANSQNPIAVTYGEEGNLHSGTNVTISGNTFISNKSNASILKDASGIAMNVSGNSQYGFATTDAAGHVGSSGFTALSSAPALNTASPVNTSGSGSTSSNGSASSSGSGGSSTPARDTTPPTLTVSQSVSGTTTSTSNVLSGTVSDAGSGVAAVEIFVNSAGRSTDIGQATLNGGNWTYNVSNLSPGTYTFYAVGFDRAGNTTATTQTGASETVVAATPAPAAPSVAAVTVAGSTLTFSGTATAGSSVTLTDTASGKSQTVGTVTAGSDGSWQISTKSIGTTVVNTLAATATTSGGSAQSAGSFVLASAGSDKLTGTAGQADLFAFARMTGRDVIAGFETGRDVIDLAGTAYHSFAQLKPVISGTSAAVIRLDAQDTITLSGVAANQLSASNFRFT